MTSHPPIRTTSAGETASRRALSGKLRDSFAHTPRTLALVWQSSPRTTFVLGVLTLAAAALPLGIAWVGKAIVDAVVAHDQAATIRYVLVELSLIVGQALVQRGLTLVRNILGMRLSADINVLILEKALTLDLHHFEDPAAMNA